MGETEVESGKPGGLGLQEGAVLAPPHPQPHPTPRQAPSAESRGPGGEGGGVA